MKLIDIVSETPIRFAYRFAFLTNFYREPLLRQMEKTTGIIRPEWTVLICLAFRDGLNQRDVCEITEQPRNTISRAAASLAEKGFITRRPDPDDARRTLLHLTAEGREMYESIMPAYVAKEARMLATLDEEELLVLDRILDKLARSTPLWAGDAD